MDPVRLIRNVRAETWRGPDIATSMLTGGSSISDTFCCSYEYGGDFTNGKPVSVAELEGGRSLMSCIGCLCY